MQFIDALRECGALSATDAEIWRARLRVARTDGFEPLPELATAVRTMAAATLDAIEAGASSVSDEVIIAQARLQALQSLNAVPGSELAAWYRELSTRVQYPPRDPAVEEAMRRSAAVGQLVPGEMERVLAGPFHLSPDMTVTSLEIYEGAIAVRWHYITRDGRFPPERGMGRTHVEIRDDVGTEYIGRGAGATRLDRAETPEGSVSGRDLSAPAPPADAAVLTVSMRDDSCDIALR
jgi:hypothetical protein